MTQPLLEVKNLRTYFVSAKGTRVVKAVDGVSVTLNEGEPLGIVGESGSGKTVTSLSILRLLPQRHALWVGRSGLRARICSRNRSGRCSTYGAARSP